jgi:uncharacterized cupredoxin-like copper-binding protein
MPRERQRILSIALIAALAWVAPPLREVTAADWAKARLVKTVALRNPEALNREHTELVLQPGEQKDLYFVTKRRGRYDMRCADHDWAGMTGDITVK